MNLRRLLFFLPLAVLPLLFLSAGDWVAPDGSGITHKPEVSDDGSTYQLKFQTTPGVNYTVESSADLQSWTPDITYRGIGHTIVHPLLALPQHDGGGSTPPPTEGPPPEPTVPASLRVQKILTSADPSATQTGLSVRWYSLDDQEPRYYTLHGQTLEDNAPPLFIGEFQPYSFFLQFFGEITDPSAVPASDSLGPKDAALISKLLDSLPEINTRIAASAASAGAAPPAPPSAGDKTFWRIRRSYVDSDSDGIQDHLEDQQGTDMWNWDTDGDGISDSQDQNPLVNDAVADPDGAGLPASLENGLLARYDFETLFPAFTFEDSSGNNRPMTPSAMALDSHGMVSKAAATGANGYCNREPSMLQGKTQFAFSFWLCLDEGSITNSNTGATQGLYGLYEYNSANVGGNITTKINSNGLSIRKTAGGELWQMGRYSYLNQSGTVITDETDAVTWSRPPGSSDDGKWQHITVVQDATGTYHLYHNGQSVASGTFAEPNIPFGQSTTGFCIGRHFTLPGSTLPAGNQTRGKFDRFRIYGRALSPAEVESLYRQDIDRDGLWDISEQKSLLWRDTDGDGVRTAAESHYTVNPYRWDKPGTDHDDDGIPSIDEQTGGTEISNPDTDGDLIPDGWEKDNGLDPTDPADGMLDSDNDGVTNLDEYSYNTNPNGSGGSNSDSDGDGTSDAAEITQGSHPGDARDGGQPIPTPERLTIKLGIGDKSGSESEDYVLHVFRIDPDTGAEKRHYTLRSGGHGEYKEETKSIFWKNDTYTFQIDWQSSNLGTSPDPANPEGADYDYTFIVEPQNDETGILIDQYDPEIRRADPAKPIAGDKSDVEDFKQTVEKKRILRITAGLVPDYNRDGKIDTADEDKVTQSNPYRFWVNDDDDHLSDSGGRSTDIPGKSAEGMLLSVNGLRDLVDFFPLQIRIREAMRVLPPESYMYGLESEDGSFQFMETDLLASDADKYLKGNLGQSDKPDNANGITVLSKVLKERFLKQAVNQQGIGGDFELAYLSALRDGTKDGILLVESGKITTKPLKLVIRKRKRTRVGGDVVAEFPLHVSTSGVESMYRHINLRATTGGTGGRATDTSAPANYPDNLPGLESGKFFVLVHGYNVNGEQARGWHAEFFKRMWWSGSKAKFVGVSWQGDESQVGPITGNYHANVVNAFQTSEALKNGLTLLGGEITISAHSLGNMLVSSAISDHNAPIKHYMLFDAAVAVEAYQGDAPKIDTMSHPEWSEAAHGGPFAERAWSSEWHKLPWDTGDYRKKLTWRDRLSDRKSVTYHNFYSSGEEVLRQHNDQTDAHLFNFIDEQIDDLINSPAETGVYSWAFQEKLKGRTLTGQVMGSRWGGWGFNITRSSAFDPLLGYSYDPLDASTLTDQELMTNPYWRRGGEDPGYAEPHAALFVTGSAGSAYAFAHRFEILAEGIPARTTPAGSRSIPVLGASNYDMMGLKNGWHPGNPNWLHGDIKDVAYIYTWKVYDSFVSLGGLAN